MKLYEIENEYLTQVDSIIIDEDTGEITENLNWDESLSHTFRDKCVAVAAYFKNIEAEAEAIRKAEGEMLKRRRSLEKRERSLREYLLVNMKRCGFDKVHSPHFDISIEKNPPHVEVMNDQDIPPEFKTVEIVTKIDKIAIRNAIKEGREVPGARMVQDEKLKVK